MLTRGPFDLFLLLPPAPITGGIPAFAGAGGGVCLFAVALLMLFVPCSTSTTQGRADEEDEHVAEDAVLILLDADDGDGVVTIEGEEVSTRPTQLPVAVEDPDEVKEEDEDVILTAEVDVDDDSCRICGFF